ncbi:zinc finger protein zic 4-like protein [Lasius niger]|uniref:Zinc finger protein zic 4-like protein n=1 Tax=Lasius niger TaxID=67767 RepID=A0A0J7KP12_LASNI|nr:zinc finger protein zic 4-like protein [Lasius niger]
MEGKMGLYGDESEGEESENSSVSVTEHTESPQPPSVPTTTTINPPPSHQPSPRGEFTQWYVCESPTVGPQPGPLLGPPPPHHLGHHFNQLHPQAAAY